MFEWLRKVAGSIFARVNGWKTLTVKPLVNGYLINFMEEKRQRKERTGPTLSNVVPRT